MIPRLPSPPQILPLRRPHQTICCNEEIRGVKLWLRLRYFVLVVDIIGILRKYPRSVDIICISWIYPHFVDISALCGYYPHFVDIICMGHITSYLDCNVFHGLQSFILVVDIIYIGHITINLAHNVRPIFHVYSFSESDWCINSFSVCNLICFSVPSSFRFVSFVS